MHDLQGHFVDMIDLNDMEEAGEEAIEGFELRGKGIHSSNAVDWKESSAQVYSDTLLGRNLNRRAITESPLIYNTDANDMVEELTLKINENSNVLLAGNSTEGKPISRQGHWNHLYKLAGGLGSGSSQNGNLEKDKELENEFLHKFGTQRPLQQSNQHSPEMAKQLVDSENITESPSGIRTKLLSSSGFPQFHVRNSSKGKGVAYKSPEPRKGNGVSRMAQSNEKAASVATVISEVSPELGVKVNHPSLHRADNAGPVSVTDGVLLREWLKPGRKVNRDENLRIFKQIVQLVDIAHSQQVALHVRPSCLKLLPCNQVKFVDTFSDKELFDSVMDMGVTSLAHQSSRKRFLKESLPPSSSLNSKQQKLIKNMTFTRQLCQSSDGPDYKREASKEFNVRNANSQVSDYDTSQPLNLNSVHRMKNKFGSPAISNTTQYQSITANIQLEHKWYTSPEEHQKRFHTFLSDIYSLGVLLFELFCCYESWEIHTAAMVDLRHRILPPKFLSEYPKEAGFCLWLLHPEPSSRPRTREILHSELICGSREVSEGQLLLPVEEDHSESELLLHFLSSLNELKHKGASKLVEDIRGIEADIEKVERMHLLRNPEVLSWKHDDPSSTRQFLVKEPTASQTRCRKHIDKLESAYFSMRSQIQLPDTNGTGRSDKDLLKNRESWSRIQNEHEGNHRSTDHLGAFFDGLCKYARCNKFELRGTLRNGDPLNAANVICSLSFDRDEEYFATAGVSKKIKIFEFSGLLNDSIDIHYPVVEMPSKSKLSCVCWNNYIKNYLAATDYDGVVQLWDASTGQGFSQYTDHEQRAWSVDFSPVDPTKLASGSDDRSVKLWSINERRCSNTIRSFANVCCVQFSADSSNLLAFGSADFKTYCYDLRNTRNPWCTLGGHGKAVSYVKFLDSATLVSASTDNTLKLWDLNKTSCSGLSTDACSLTFRGHMNEKNFVGLSVSDGYIACGSESNEVYSYYKTLPMPVTAYKFGSMDPISGQENGDDTGQFVSSVCWRGKSDMLIAANSSGSIKVLQMM